MARRETPARDAGKKQDTGKKRKAVRSPVRPDAGRGIVGGDALETIKKRAEELGLILHARGEKVRAGTSRKKKAEK